MATYSATTEGEEALAAMTTETVLALQGATVIKARLAAFGISFDGIVSADAPVVVKLRRISTFANSTGATEVKFDPDDNAANVAALHTFTVEPTKGDTLMEREVHPQGGVWEWQFPLGQEPVIDSSTSDGLCLEATSPSAVNVLAYMIWTE